MLQSLSSPTLIRKPLLTLESGPIIHLPPAIPAARLPLPAPRVSGLLVAPAPSPAAAQASALDRIPSELRQKVQPAIDAIVDAMLAYVAGETRTTHALDKACSALSVTVREIRPPAHRPRQHIDPVKVSERQKKADAETAIKLAKLVEDWTGLKVAPLGEYAVSGHWMFVYKPWYPSGGLQIFRRHPDGVTWMPGELAFGKADADQIMETLDKRARGLTSRTIVERGPVVEGPRSRPNLRPEDVQAFWRGFNKGLVNRE